MAIFRHNGRNRLVDREEFSPVSRSSSSDMQQNQWVNRTNELDDYVQWRFAQWRRVPAQLSTTAHKWGLAIPNGCSVQPFEKYTTNSHFSQRAAMTTLQNRVKHRALLINRIVTRLHFFPENQAAVLLRVRENGASSRRFGKDGWGMEATKRWGCAPTWPRRP